MLFLDVNKNNLNSAEKLQKMIDTKKNIFVLVYMIGCSPCKNTMPQWKKLKNHKGIHHLKNNNDVIVANVEQSMCQNLHHKHLEDIMSFPTIKHIKDDIVHNYENERTVDAFSNWINSVMQEEGKSNKKHNKLIMDANMDMDMDIDNIIIKSKPNQMNYGNIDRLFKLTPSKTRKLRRKSKSKSRSKSKSKSRSKSKSKLRSKSKSKSNPKSKPNSQIKIRPRIRTKSNKQKKMSLPKSSKLRNKKANANSRRMFQRPLSYTKSLPV